MKNLNIEKPCEAKVDWCSKIENLTCSISGGTLTIEGNDKIPNCCVYDNVREGLFTGLVQNNGIISVVMKDVLSIGEIAFRDCCSLTSITIPDSVESIEYGAFWGCSGLTSITIPNSVKSIERCAFNDCRNLQTITIGNSVEFIGDYVFCGCRGLTEIINYVEKPQKLDRFPNIFYGVDKDNCILRVNESCLSDYNSDIIWRGIFKNIENISQIE